MWSIIGEVFFFLSVGVLLFGGLVLTVVNLPGVWLIWGGILLASIVRGLEEIPLWFLIVTFFVSVIVTLIDNFVIPLAAKRFGGGRWGMLGGLVGAIVGFVFANIPGLLVGPFLGAFILEYVLAKKNSQDAFRSGFGSFLGVIFSIAMKMFFCVSMIVFFLIIWIF